MTYYTVGGTVTGLAVGPKLTLSDGTDSVTFTQGGGTFTFNNAVASGGSFQITVTSQPLAQTCTVTGGSGSNITASVSSVAVNCTTSEAVLVSFDGGDGQGPEGRLIQGSDGNFYGVTVGGGTNNTGTVFRVGPAASGGFTTLYSFGATNSGDGAAPYSPLIEATDGNLYGTTSSGGANGTGAIYKITTNGTESIVYNFPAVNTSDVNGSGAGPVSGLIQASDGNLYGVTQGGGANGGGTVFRLTLGGTLTVLHSFGAYGMPGPDGSSAVNLIQATDGDLYGLTASGGQGGFGAVFKISLSGTESLLYSAPSDTGAGVGAVPGNGIIQASDGNFYGMVSAGGTEGWGTVFQLTPSGVETTLYSFTTEQQTNGLQPYGALIQASDGLLYGTATHGGANGTGLVFVMTLNGQGSRLYPFGAIPSGDGINPTGSLIQGKDGLIYGVTYSGGSVNDSNTNLGNGIVFHLQ